MPKSCDFRDTSLYSAGERASERAESANVIVRAQISILLKQYIELYSSVLSQARD